MQQFGFGGERYSDGERDKIQQLLDRKLGKDELAVRPGPGGGVVESHHVITRANFIFEFNGWATNIENITKDFEECTNGRWNVGYSAIVRVTLRDGSYREDVGCGEGVNPNRLQAIEKAKKEAVTDARKRALRLFGDGLGNCIYDKSYVQNIRTEKVTMDALDLHRANVPLPQMVPSCVRSASSGAMVMATPAKVVASSSSAASSSTSSKDVTTLAATKHDDNKYDSPLADPSAVAATSARLPPAAAATSRSIATPRAPPSSSSNTSNTSRTTAPSATTAAAPIGARAASLSPPNNNTNNNVSPRQVTGAHGHHHSNGGNTTNNHRAPVVPLNNANRRVQPSARAPPAAASSSAASRGSASGVSLSPPQTNGAANGNNNKRPYQQTMSAAAAAPVAPASPAALSYGVSDDELAGLDDLVNDAAASSNVSPPSAKRICAE